MVEWAIIQNNQQKLVEELNKLKISFRFFNDYDTGKTKWTSLNVQDLDKILEKLQWQEILDEEYDNRLSPVDKLKVNQLKFECQTNGLPTAGKKVCNIYSPFKTI